MSQRWLTLTWLMRFRRGVDINDVMGRSVALRYAEGGE